MHVGDEDSKLDIGFCVAAAMLFYHIVSMHAGNEDSELDIGFGVAAAMFFYHIVLTGDFATLECHKQGEMGVRKQTPNHDIGPVFLCSSSRSRVCNNKSR